METGIDKRLTNMNLILQQQACLVHEADPLPNMRGFQGQYASHFIEMGTDEYEPWHTGVSLGSAVYATGGIQKSIEYLYRTLVSFTITFCSYQCG